MERLHYAITADWGLYVETVPVCGNDFRRAKTLTGDWREVTCPACLTLCGFEAAPLKQLTSCEGDPMRKAA